MDHDHAVVGGGCAGLSLALELLERTGGRVVVIEPRTSYGKDRTFCFWSVRPHRFAAEVAHTWPRWRFATDEVEQVHDARGLAYCHLPADRFYAAALGALRGQERVTLRLGTRVEAIEDEGDRVRVRTTAGDIVARLAFDSRPDPLMAEGPLAHPDDVRWLQHFVGHVVETPDDVFDTGVATLMDFRVRQDLGVHFIYVLPFSPRRALVESTFFSEGWNARETYEEAIASYLRERLGVSRWTVVEEESGAIPMTTEPVPQRRSARVYRIGVVGGAAKPSTGYAYLAIQRQARELASRLSREELPEPPLPRPLRATALDRVFMSLLRRHRHDAPRIFGRLFSSNPPERLVRFLSDEAPLAETLQLMTTMATPAMVMETVRSAGLWMRSP